MQFQAPGKKIAGRLFLNLVQRFPGTRRDIFVLSLRQTATGAGFCSDKTGYDRTTNKTRIMHQKNVITTGTSIDQAKKALILLHGRGATAQDILSLSGYLEVEGYALLAPQATNNTWYPYSFLAPVKQNEPWLSSAVALVEGIVSDVEAQGIASENIYLLGFSQGACLTLEFAARNAKRYGGLIAFTGGLIGDTLDKSRYMGDFAGTPVFLGTSNPDMHVPVERVQASAGILRAMNAVVTEKIYNGMGHTISDEEIQEVNRSIFRQAKPVKS